MTPNIIKAIRQACAAYKLGAYSLIETIDENTGATAIKTMLLEPSVDRIEGDTNFMVVKGVIISPIDVKIDVCKTDENTANADLVFAEALVKAIEFNTFSCCDGFKNVKGSFVSETTLDQSFIKFTITAEQSVNYSSSEIKALFI